MCLLHERRQGARANRKESTKIKQHAFARDMSLGESVKMKTNRHLLPIVCQDVTTGKATWQGKGRTQRQRTGDGEKLEMKRGERERERD